MASAHDLSLVAGEELRGHLETSDEPDALVARVPPLRDLAGVLLVADRLEDRLIREPRREAAIGGRGDELELGLTDGAP